MPCAPLARRLGNAPGRTDRFLARCVIGRPKVDRVLVDAVQQQAGDLGHPGFGVAVCGGVIAIDVAEIALAIDQRVARGKILREANERVVDRLIAVGMEAAHHVADDLGRFLEGRRRVEPQQVHAVKNAPVHRLEPVARVRQRAVHDGGQRVLEIALLERLAQRDLLHMAARRGNQLLAHAAWLARESAVNKRGTAAFCRPFYDIAGTACCALTAALTKLPRASGIASPRGSST